ncbi:hypothetical protein HPB47_020872 [Ixodes persulcatus]|uniref:Uncharacterized protein n=1 Tax=Ixodes persulcatus TaxID=34615 RepID=A0AC60QEF8_IXOPE|nr:hypothetical protein HPB47_020872 [Ixodes persulcatus]
MVVGVLVLVSQQLAHSVEELRRASITKFLSGEKLLQPAALRFGLPIKDGCLQMIEGVDRIRCGENVGQFLADVGWQGEDGVKGTLVSDYFGAGQPLFLTPLIDKKELDKARAQSRVGYLGSVKDVPSYSGFLTVNPNTGSNIFFWFFPAMENPETAPVLMWLQGGPGSSSMFGLFVEHGPYYVAKGGVPKLRKTTWARRYSMLYVDNPVGVGFSFTEEPQGYTRNDTDVARDLFEALEQFFTLFPEYVNNDFYVTGESYAGKYIPAIAYVIDTAIQPRVKINLKGIAIGNGVVDRVTMMDYADYLYGISLVDRNQAAAIRQKTDAAVDLIKQGRYLDANDALQPVFDGKPSMYENFTGFTNYYNYLYSKTPADQEYYRCATGYREGNAPRGPPPLRGPAMASLAVMVVAAAALPALLLARVLPKDVSLYRGDIEMPDVIEGDIYMPPITSLSDLRARTKETPLWHQGLVHFVIDQAFDSWEKEEILSAMQQIESVSCVHFKERTNEESFVHILSSQGRVPISCDNSYLTLTSGGQHRNMVAGKSSMTLVHRPR